MERSLVKANGEMMILFLNMYTSDKDLLFQEVEIIETTI